MKTPLPLDNPPGRDAISYRVGRYGDFRQAMLARLSDTSERFAPLLKLRTRAPDDPTIALLEAFASVGEVLTFYQERLANEGYLGTATEPQSLAELARLTGYRPKGGLASSVFLAFTADPSSSLTLPSGARAQSVPPPGQTAQSFETIAALAIDGAWNAMKPRLSRPTQASADLSQLYVQGIATGLKPNDPLLLVMDGVPDVRRVASAIAQPDRQRTVVVLQPEAGGSEGEPSAEATDGTAVAASAAVATTPSGSSALGGSLTISSGPAASSPTPTEDPPAAKSLIDVVHDLAKTASKAPAPTPSDSTGIQRSTRSLLAATSDAAVALAAGSSRVERSRVYKALAQTPLAPAAKLEVYAFRSTTAPSGARAAPRSIDANGRVMVPPQEWTITDAVFGDPETLAIAITVSRDSSATTFPSALKVAIGGDGEGMQIASEITYRGAKVELNITATSGASKSDTLAPLGKVTCTLRELDASGLGLLYEFDKQPVSLLVSFGADGSVRAVNQIATSAVTSLSATGSARNQRIDVTAMLALSDGTRSIEQPNVLYLDGVYETIVPGSWVAFAAPGSDDQGKPDVADPARVAGSATVSRTEYGQTARVTRLALESAWIDPPTTNFNRAIRETTVFADSYPLALADEDIVDPVAQTVSSPTLELDGFVPGLESGRWLIVTGERLDLPGSISGELAMLAGAEHQGSTVKAPGPVAAADAPYLAGETVHTTLTFAAPLAYTYKRETVTILGNVAPATQGESVDEILGSGSGTLANQSFALKKPPLTYVSAATPSGSASTLRIYVNGIEWHEVGSLGSQGPRDRVFITQPVAGGGTTVCFGDGVHGARLPTGADNVRARYRSRLGASGNVAAETITTLLARPLGLKSVTNPLAATGGAEPENADAIRRAAPLGLVSLSRLVSVGDYEDFALGFAGIAKASARRFAGPDGSLVHLTIAGADDDTLDPTSDLWTSLAKALADLGDGGHQVELAARKARLALVSANIAVDPDRLWSDIEPVLRKRLLDMFSFRRRQFGQDLHPSDVITQIQGVPGVSYVDLRLLSSVAAPVDAAELATAVNSGGVETIVARLARAPGEPGHRRLEPAELVYLSASLPAMLVLNEVTP